VRHQLRSVVILTICVSVLAGCAAEKAYRRGEAAGGIGDWDAAVVHLTRAVQEAPDKPEYKVALERAMGNASRAHLAKGIELEAQGRLEEALAEYRAAIEYDGRNRPAVSRAADLERTIRERLEALLPKAPIEAMREEARRQTAEPILNPSSREPLEVRFTNASLRDILNFIGGATGINISYDQQFVDKPYTIELSGVTLEQALNQILRSNSLFYKIMDQRTILIIPDSPQNRAKYEEQVIRTFFLSHADATEVAQTINTVIRVPQMPVQPTVIANKTANTITIRATTAVADVIERLIRANDNPRAEVIIDVQILEVNRARAKQYGVSLSNYALGVIFSPEVAPPNVSGAAGTPPPFNLNTISQGVSTADYYMSVPTATIRFLESDSQTRIIAKPQLRGSEGTKLSLNLGEDIPVLSSVFGSAAAGGLQTVPVSSYNYRPVGVIVEMTPRVTYDGEIILDVTVESSTLGQSIEVGGQLAPTFGSRKVTTRLRLREGESNLLAGLLREDERKSLRGFPGLLRLPGLRQLFSDNDNQIQQTDIVMLLTPHIVRTHQLTQEDLNPIFIGTQANIGLTGPPPLIAPIPEEEAAPPAAPPPGAPALPARPGVPPGAPAAPVPSTGVPPPAPPVTPPVELPETPPEPAPAAEPEAVPAGGTAQIIVTPPGTEFRVGGGPYTVPVSINGASRVSIVSLTITYDPATLSVRSVQEGTFMRQGGMTPVFTQQVDPASGRIDIAITRPDDASGASGAGLLAAILFETTAPGTVTLTPSGIATTPEGATVLLQLSPVTVNVR